MADVNMFATRLDDLIQLMRDLVIGVNGLRSDFRSHDHGSTYTPAALRINASADAISGSEASAQITSASTPAQYEAMFTELFRILGGSSEAINRATRF